MVKRYMFTSTILFSVCIFSQTVDSLEINAPTIDSSALSRNLPIEGILGPSVILIEDMSDDIKEGHILLLVNDIILPKKIASKLFQNHSKYFDRFKFYSSEKAFRKFRITTSKGVLFLKPKQGILDIRALEDFE